MGNNPVTSSTSRTSQYPSVSTHKKIGQLVLENQKQAAGCSDREVEQVGLEKTCFFAVGVEKSVFPGLGGNATLSLVSGDYESS